VDVTLEKIVNLAKRRGFIFPGSEIYGGLANSWDYGPLGVLLKNNLRDAWWKHFVTSRRDMVAIDASILMNPKVWEVSGHVANFNDPLVEDKVTHQRYRLDQLLEEQGETVTGLELSELQQKADALGLKSPAGNELTEPKRFNLLFETFLGATEDNRARVYLRGELAQAMFVDFKRVMETMRPAIPFGIAQAGRVFRNEITPGNFTFRTLEFDLMEFEYFVAQTEWEQSFDYWLGEMQRWVTTEVGLAADKLRVREHTPEELSHYSKRTVDIEYQTPFGWRELFGLAYRTDFDLKNHAEASGQDLRLTEAKSGEKFYPHVVEPTFGLTRLLLMVLLDAYDEEPVKSSGGNHGPGETRTVLRLKPYLAPFQAAVLPLSRKEKLIKIAQGLADDLSRHWQTDYDETQSIGKRYRRQDEIGTPYCLTVDFDSLEDQCVTVRERDSMTQERIALDRAVPYLHEKLSDR
jgi:glycyl-tRNA synthetase